MPDYGTYVPLLDQNPSGCEDEAQTLITAH